MKIELIEDLERLLKEDVFNIFRQCMYKQTFEVYRDKIIEYIGDKNIKIFVGLIEDKIIGIIVLKLADDKSAELMGIAVCKSFQKQGIGGFLVKESANRMRLRRMTAETDGDAKGFYKKLGFDIVEETRDYANGKVVRYRCSLAL